MQDTAVIRCLQRLASLRLTVFLLIMLAIGILLALWGWGRFAVYVSIGLFLLAVNLLATVCVRPQLRRNRALLVFHLALLAILVLVAVGRLTYLKGQAEVLEGEAFEGHLVSADAGILHPWHLDRVRFVNQGFSVAYAPGLKRQETRNQVFLPDAVGGDAQQVIGDDKPLILDGYRFYTTWNKGFALLFEWQPRVGEPTLGAVHLPSYPINSLKQAQQWHLPGIREPVWAMLQFEGDLIPSDRDGHFRLPDDYQVVVRQGEQRWVLTPGQDQVIDLPGGQLRYHELRTWMGYMVTWDATIPWLLVASTLAVLALGWHFWQQFSRRPWNPDGDDETEGRGAEE